MILLCRPDELPEGQSRGFVVDGLNILLVRRNGQIHAYENRCPHRGIPLEWTPDQFLDHSGSLIQCATHGALFLIESGECVTGPCVGEVLEPVGIFEDADGIWLLDAA
ncbi:Rieske (2Fe-2S) protein [Pseudomonas sp. JS3066]|uniref:Rieske (2Fe-2S) protein n=1 Tax=unclassified Pseudomonas TaxID=196821 RepID=UPI000EAA69EE|nr:MULTISPECIES: Rieske (2Fe-2S) protein [unclassified Pseudomonas]AYF90089.1 Rieske (2Fe-2S) protein [Pseudomonas sp. DY-1]WVK92333.1 Rieske (2Fe-2S) protein [Pseudomonas sp. JS3066]